MRAGARIAVVVPAYNEAPHIAAALDSIPAFIDRVVVVDDASHDATAQVVSARRDPRLTLVRHTRNLGVGAALRTGYAEAFACGADVAVVMAGDGQMDPRDLPGLLKPVLDGSADYTKGDRLSHPDVAIRMPARRRLGNLILSALTRAATGLRVHDSQCGYTALSRAAYERIPTARLWQGYGYPNDLLGWLAQGGARVADVLVRPVYGSEVSGIRLRHALVVIPYVLMRVWWRRARAGRGLGGTRGEPVLPASA